MTLLERLGRWRDDPAGLAGVDILWLGARGSDDPTRVGGKAANLSRLAARWPVPPGFCLPAELHRRIEAAGIAPDACARPLRRLLAPAYRELGDGLRRRVPVAVRSSATDEDTEEASFAGQHETVLDVVGTRAVADAVLRCCRSARGETARRYRDAHGLEDDAHMAVLVQELVDADVSGVAFSANPVTGATDEVLINAGFGLGEGVVDGLVTPDTYAVDHDGVTVRDRQIADKDVAVARGPAGTRTVEVPSERRRQPALDDRRCTQVAQMAVQLASEMGWPVDVEFAYRDEELFLLQCRPITTLPRS